MALRFSQHFIWHIFSKANIPRSCAAILAGILFVFSIYTSSYPNLFLYIGFPACMLFLITIVLLSYFSIGHNHRSSSHIYGTIPDLEALVAMIQILTFAKKESKEGTILRVCIHQRVKSRRRIYYKRITGYAGSDKEEHRSYSSELHDINVGMVGQMFRLDVPGVTKAKANTQEQRKEKLIKDFAYSQEQASKLNSNIMTWCTIAIGPKAKKITGENSVRYIVFLESNTPDFFDGSRLTFLKQFADNITDYLIYQKHLT